LGEFLGAHIGASDIDWTRLSGAYFAFSNTLKRGAIGSELLFNSAMRITGINVLQCFG
jgi:hypothetical protein